MRAKRTLRVLVLVLGFGLLPATAVLATHSPTAEQVIVVASGSPWFMDCKGVSPRCVEQPGSDYPTRKAWIQPNTGALTRVVTQVEGVYSDTQFPYTFSDPDQLWAEALLNVGCANSPEVAKFIDQVAGLKFQPAGSTVESPVVGECSMKGTFFAPGTNRIYCLGAQGYCFVIESDILPSAASPIPSPTPSPSPTPTATPTLTPVPTARPTATPKPTAKPIVTAKPTATATVTATASASESPSASPTATPSPSPTPEQSVKGITFTPEPSVPEGAPDQGVGGWPGTVPGPGDVSTKPADLGGSAMGALILLVAMGFIGELFNNTMETNYDRILGWWKKSWVGRIGRGVGGLFGGGSS